MRRLVILLATVGAVACGSDSPSAPAEPTVTGSYSLSTVNGQEMPLVLGQNDTAMVELISGHIVLSSGGQFTDIVNLRYTIPSGTSLEADTLSGSYARSGSTLTFQPSDGSGNYTLAVTDVNTLTETAGSVVIVYKRE